MKLSYIISTYNRQELLENAVRYVLRERCDNSELIVVDDHSHTPVRMPEMARIGFPNAHQLIRNPSNLGVIGARNAGIAAANGEFLLFLDDDDESLPNRTTDLLSKIENSEFDFVAACSLLKTGPMERVVPIQSGFLLTPEKLLLYPSHINAVIWRRAMFAETGGLNNRVPYLGEHLSMVLCLLNGGTAWLSDALVARFEYLPAGLTQQANQQKELKGHLLAFYKVLLEAGKTASFRRLCKKVLNLLQQEEIMGFDDYLKKLAMEINDE